MSRPPPSAPPFGDEDVDGNEHDNDDDDKVGPVDDVDQMLSRRPTHLNPGQLSQARTQLLNTTQPDYHVCLCPWRSSSLFATTCPLPGSSSSSPTSAAAPGCSSASPPGSRLSPTCQDGKVKVAKFLISTPPASKSPAPIMDLGAQDQQKNPKSEGLQWDLRILELDLRFRGGLGLSPIGLENFRGGLSPSPPLNLKSNSKILKSNWT